MKYSVIVESEKYIIFTHLFGSTVRTGGVLLPVPKGTGSRDGHVVQ